MSALPSVLLAVAAELANMAKANLPELNDGEEIRREWYADGMYYRETALDGVIFTYQYDFRQRKSHRTGGLKEGDVND